MMQITIKTKVSASLETVWQGFDRQLFMKLAPPLPRVRLLRFDGCAPGDLVELELHFVLFKQRWVSQIVSQHQSENEIEFVDEGIKLPFFLRQWRHQHRLIRLTAGTEIVDHIQYHSPNRMLDWLLYPSMWLQFAYRGPIYRKTFQQR